jgi:hypothetical protein
LQETRKNKLPEGWKKSLPKFDDVESKATRAYSGEVINAIADAVPQLLGGSADLAPSNNTTIKSSADFQAGQYENRNIHFGIREHAMGATMNGMALYGSVIPFGGTFQTFSDYMRPQFASPRFPACRQFSFSRTIRLVSAKTVRRTNQSNISPLCAPFRISLLFVRATPTKRVKPGAPLSNETTRRRLSPFHVKKLRN